jgi:hypothetical protein
MNKIKKRTLFILVSVLLFACGNKKVYNGDSMMNYPDMVLILKENLQPYQKDPFTFKLITIENGKKDSAFLKAKEVDWESLKSPFLKANVFQKKLDKHYRIDVLTDTLYNKITMLLTATEPSDITSTMSITARSADNKILSVYAETRDAGFLVSTEYKLLYVNGRTLQVQEVKKYPFMDAKRKVQTLTFLN